MTRTSDLNVLSYLHRSTERNPDRPALIFGGGGPENLGGALSYGDLWRRAERLARGLRREGLQPGDRAIVMIPMSLELYAVLLGLLAVGAVAVFVDPWIGRKQIAAFAAFADPRAYLGIPKSHLLRLLDRRLRRIPLTVTTGRRFWRWPARRSMGELSAGGGDGSIQPVAADDPALITFTSGSSGLPKGANRTHGFLAAQHRALAEEFPYSDDDVDMAMFPVFALNNLAWGITTVVPQIDFSNVAGVDPEPILAQMRRHSVTTCTASPPFFDRLAGHVARKKQSRPALRRILSGGAPVSDEQLRSWQRSFPQAEILVVYGSTEAEPVAHIAAEERLEVRNSLGPAFPGYCVGHQARSLRTKLLPLSEQQPEEPELQEAEPNQVGELLVAGDHVCKDYFRNPDAVKENKLRTPDGEIWHRMGDTGYFDTLGRFWLVGRVHSTIFRAGQAVHAQLVEQAAGEADSKVRRAAAVGLPDPQLGQRVVLVIETESGQELREEVEARLQQSGHPVDEIILTDEPLPLDPRHNSKIDYPKLRDRLLVKARSQSRTGA